MRKKSVKTPVSPVKEVMLLIQVVQQPLWVWFDCTPNKECLSAAAFPSWAAQHEEPSISQHLRSYRNHAETGHARPPNLVHSPQVASSQPDPPLSRVPQAPSFGPPSFFATPSIPPGLRDTRSSSTFVGKSRGADTPSQGKDRTESSRTFSPTFFDAFEGSKSPYSSLAGDLAPRANAWPLCIRLSFLERNHFV
jgi:hypothetical protein